jgi:hypothetical protein
MKLLHYFITQKNYSPIILQGVNNEIWLENMDSQYRIIRIVSNHIHNEEQLEYDVFKAKHIVGKIKRKIHLTGQFCKRPNCGGAEFRGTKKQKRSLWF